MCEILESIDRLDFKGKGLEYDRRFREALVFRIEAAQEYTKIFFSEDGIPEAVRCAAAKNAARSWSRAAFDNKQIGNLEASVDCESKAREIYVEIYDRVNEAYCCVRLCENLDMLGNDVAIEWLSLRAKFLFDRSYGVPNDSLGVVLMSYVERYRAV
jgi:hypothetical protein